MNLHIGVDRPPRRQFTTTFPASCTNCCKWDWFIPPLISLSLSFSPPSHLHRDAQKGLSMVLRMHTNLPEEAASLSASHGTIPSKISEPWRRLFVYPCKPQPTPPSASSHRWGRNPLSFHPRHAREATETVSYRDGENYGPHSSLFTRQRGPRIPPPL